MRPVIMDPRDARWYHVGDYTLCDTCGRAIRLEVRDIRGLQGPVAIWVHTGPTVAGHFSEPKVSWAEAAYRRDVQDGLVR